MKRKIPLLATAAAGATLVAYRAVKGYGIFNKIRYRQLHSVVSRYLETHHPDSTYSSISDVGDGYSAIVTDHNKSYLLHITKTKEGVYVFSEKEMGNGDI